MTSFKERLLSADNTFLSALSQGGDALNAFDKSWESLMAEVDLAMASNDLDPETTSLIQTTTSRIAMLADASIELMGLHDSFTSQFMSQIDSLMSELTLVDHPPRAPSSTADVFSTTPSAADLDAHLRMPSLKRTRESDCVHSESSKRRRHGTSDHTPRKALSSRLIRPRSLSPSVPLPSSPVSLATVSTESSKSDNLDMPLNANKRKRRFSESNASSSPCPSSKRLYAGPRLHAVSDSFVSRTVAPISKTTSFDVLHANAPIKMHVSMDPLDATMDETLIPGQLDPLSRLPLPTDFFLDSFIDSTWSQPPLSHNNDIDALVQSICQTVDRSAAHPSDSPFPTYDIDSPDALGSDLSPASTPPYPTTPLLAPFYPPDLFDGVTTTNGDLSLDILVGAANENCITLHVPATPVPKDLSMSYASLTDCGDSEAYWDLFLQPSEPLDLPYELSSPTLPKGVGARSDDVRLVVGADF